MPNNLKGSRPYLAGPIDRVDDHGLGWRRKFHKLSAEAGLQLTILDPTDKPGDFMSETVNEKEIQNQFRSSKNWHGMTQFMKKIRRIDLRMVDASTFVVAYVDPDEHLCGTYDEIFTAEDQQKPVLIICPGGIDRLPSWLFAVVYESEVFADVESCIEYLKNIDNIDFHSIDPRWVFLEKLLEQDKCQTRSFLRTM